MNFGSLFAGIGGLDLGLERAGMTCKWQVEIDEYARRVLAKHWPDVRRWDDIKTFPPNTDSKGLEGAERKGVCCEGWLQEPTNSDWRVDLICCGFPCQDISYAGRGAGLGGERSGLFFEAVRVVRQLRPRYVLLENVAALLSRGLDRVCGELAEIGYGCEWHCIPAAAVGAPHVRDRVFVIGELREGPLADSERLERSEHERERFGFMQRTSDPCEEIPDTNSPRLAIGEGKDTKRAGPIIRAKPSRNEWWATEPAICRVANGVPSRMDRLRGLGNAVVPQVAEYIGQQILKEEQCPEQRESTR